MTKISVIIPTFQDDIVLENLLQSLAGMNIDEIIISDGEAREALPKHLISNDLPLTYVQSDKGRGPQIKTGIALATSPMIWILHADNIPDKNAPLVISDVLQNANISLLTFTLAFDKNSFLLKLFAWFARWDSSVSTFGDQGFALRLADYEALDLDLDNYPLLEDVALRSALKTKGRVRRSPLKIITSARRFEKRGVWRTQFLNLSILWRYFRGQSPTALYQLYYDP